MGYENKKRVCCIRDYHVWEAAAGEVLVYEREPHNALDWYDPAACLRLRKYFNNEIFPIYGIRCALKTTNEQLYVIYNVLVGCYM